MHQPAVEEHFHERLDAADRDQFRHHITATGLEIRQHRNAFADAGEVVQCEFDPCILRDRQQVQHRVGRSAEGDDHGNGVFKGLARQDVAWTQTVLH